MKITIVGIGNVGLNVEYVGDPWQATENLGSVMVVTECRQFKQLCFRRLNNEIGSKKIVDGRNISHPQPCVDYGLNYAGVDRSSGLYS